MKPTEQHIFLSSHCSRTEIHEETGKTFVNAKHCLYFYSK